MTHVGDNCVVGAPFNTFCRSREMLYCVTRSGKVSDLATCLGTPTCGVIYQRICIHSCAYTFFGHKSWWPPASDMPLTCVAGTLCTPHNVTRASSTPRLGSGEMTVRPEKSTRLPDRLPRNRPCLPFSRCTKPLQHLWNDHQIGIPISTPAHQHHLGGTKNQRLVRPQQRRKL